MNREEADLVASMMDAYRTGAFPMAEGRNAAQLGLPIHWYRPDPRAVLPIRPELVGLDRGVHVSRRLMRTVRSGRFHVTTDRAFERVIHGCALPRRETESGSSETWIDDRILNAFLLLHEAGHAHSIEAWRESDNGELRLVGGVYGLAVGGVFCGESMFSLPEQGGTDASKVCLVHLITHCTRLGFSIIDTQFVNPHLEQFGVVEIPLDSYLEVLEQVKDEQISWRDLEPM
ncbi:MAG TPA: leucyl/phenylalanyl-tRNA--protein transferase [Phycisphaerales bacterium]|nr:leucyl/phenylalanyl-tRNA--protein transferase [Phycisphaerales bacterium]